MRKYYINNSHDHVLLLPFKLHVYFVYEWWKINDTTAISLVLFERPIRV